MGDSHTTSPRVLAFITVVFWVVMFGIALYFSRSPRELPPRQPNGQAEVPLAA